MIFMKEIKKVTNKTSLNGHFKNNKNHILGDGWNKYWSLFPRPPIPMPIPSVATVPCQGAEQIDKNTFLMISYDCLKKAHPRCGKSSLPRGRLKKQQHILGDFL